MLTSKERAYLKKLANRLPAIFQVGKGGISPELTGSIDGALEARELIKINVLDNCSMDVREIAETISERTKSEVVQIIGNRIIFYRKSKKKQIIEFDI